MSSGAKKSSDIATARSWAWVSSKTFEPLPYYQRSWQILKADWFVFVWKILADLAGRAASIGVLGLILVVVGADFFTHLSAGVDTTRWLDRLVTVARSPAFIIAVVGLVALANLAGTALRALAHAGLWGLLADGLEDRPIKRLRTFGVRALQYFPQVFALAMVRLATHALTGLLAAAFAISFVYASSQGLTQGPVLPAAIVIAGALVCLAAWSGLTRLVFEVAGAPLIIDGADLGEALLRGCYFAVDNFWSIYRLLIVALGILLIPLGFYWVILMANNLTLVWPALAPLGTVLRLGGEIVLWTSISALAVLFYGAVFAFYHDDDQAHEIATASGDTGGASPAGRPSIFSKGVALQEFLPAQAPYRVDLQQLVAPPGDDESTAPAEEVPQETDATKPNDRGQSTPDPDRDGEPDPDRHGE